LKTSDIRRGVRWDKLAEKSNKIIRESKREGGIRIQIDCLLLGGMSKGSATGNGKAIMAA